MRTIDDSLQSWIAENLLGGCTPESIIQTLCGIEVDPNEAQAAVHAAIDHPYLKPAMALRTTLHKREALLKTLDFYQRMNPDHLKLTRKKLPPYASFIKDYYSQNRPGLFKNAADHWPAMQWTPQKLLEKVGGDTMVEVQYNRESNKNYELDSIAHKKQMRFDEFIAGVESKVTNDFYLTANNSALKNSVLRKLLDDIGTLGDGYIDMQNMDGHMFLWIGPKGTITPLHHDRTNNLFLQVYGSKRFRLIPAVQVPYMYNDVGVFSKVDLLDPKPETYPLYSRIDAIDVTLEAGDLLFIPIGWWHHVVGETTSISLSFTNIVADNRFIEYPS